MKNPKLVWSLAIFSITANILDSVTTRIGLGMGKTEANPIVNYFISMNLYWLFDVIKIMVIIYLVWPFKYNPVYSCLIKSPKQLYQNIGYLLLGFAAAFFLLLVISNLRVIF